MKTYVLILAGNQQTQWPAVIGGYATEEDAIAAGEEATKHIPSEYYGCDSYMQKWKNYTVIPGAAS